MTTTSISRRRLMLTAAAATALPATAHAQVLEAPAVNRRNIMGFTLQHWQDHFDTLGKGAIVADIDSRTLHFWSGDGETYKMYPSSVPRTEELTKRGYTRIVRKRVGPDWTPTASMMERDPTLKYMPPGPGNPLGTHAMYLSWPAYLIHGTHDTRKIGRMSSDGCIGLYNHKVEELFAIAPVGTQVRLL